MIARDAPRSEGVKNATLAAHGRKKKAAMFAYVERFSLFCNIEITPMNRLFHSGVASAVAFLLMACTSNPPQQTETTATPEPGTVANRQSGIHQLQPSHSEDTVTLRGTQYTYCIDRRPDTTLVAVQDEQGGVFADNSITLTVRRGSAVVIQKVFTKADFSTHLDAGFRKNGILEGLVFDCPAAGGLQFAASVCYPQSDLYMPLTVTVGPDGRITIRKDNTLDTSSADDDEEV